MSLQQPHEPMPVLPSANPQHLGAADPRAEQLLCAMWFELPADSHFFVQFWESKPRLAEPLAAQQWHSWGSGQPEPQPAATSPLAHGNKPMSRAWVFVWMCPIGAQLRGPVPCCTLWHTGRGGFVLHEHLLVLTACWCKQGDKQLQDLSCGGSLDVSFLLFWVRVTVLVQLHVWTLLFQNNNSKSQESLVPPLLEPLQLCLWG